MLKITFNPYWLENSEAMYSKVLASKVEPGKSKKKLFKINNNALKKNAKIKRLNIAWSFLKYFINVNKIKINVDNPKK